MAHYIIGDIQGCLDALKDLLNIIKFDPANDKIWFAGDLVSRGPDSIGTLRFIKNLGDSCNSVLGNHDLHLIAAYHMLATVKPKEGLHHVLQAPDVHELMAWLVQRPMLLEDAQAKVVLTHAGIPACWSLSQARALARELEQVLRGEHLVDFLRDMYGNQPAGWSDSLTGSERLRVITNYFTRMRLCHSDHSLDFDHKEGSSDLPSGLTPWFKQSNLGLEGYRVVFGHWAALNGQTHSPQFIGTDTGCVWGGKLTAYRVEDGVKFHNRKGCVGISLF